VRSLSGRDLAASIRAVTAQRAAELAAAGTPPRFAVVTATADPASAWYVRALGVAAAKAGIGCDVVDAEASGAALSSSNAVSSALARLSADPSVHGIIAQTPLPDGVSLAGAAQAIAPGKGRGRREPLLSRAPGGGPAGLCSCHRRGGRRAARPPPDTGDRSASSRRRALRCGRKASRALAALG
jgi:methylenetetrahydrofolate dehydrogenase (NADP+) / methenyltetrahydrofolate cyclohydrolase